MLGQISVSSNEEASVIKIGERFDFNLHKDFRDAYERDIGNANVGKYVIDLQDTKYMDSSALGMLLVFRERVGDRATIVLSNCNDEIRSILQIANFEKLFNIM